MHHSAFRSFQDGLDGIGQKPIMSHATIVWTLDHPRNVLRQALLDCSWISLGGVSEYKATALRPSILSKIRAGALKQ
jgi:hypothetical protein